LCSEDLNCIISAYPSIYFKIIIILYVRLRDVDDDVIDTGVVYE